MYHRVRYAAAPVGNLRFAAPQAPVTNRSKTIEATEFPPFCPQTGASKETPSEYGFVSQLGNEDCLFLNVSDKDPTEEHWLTLCLGVCPGKCEEVTSVLLDS